MRPTLAAALLLVTCTAPALAQSPSRLYAGATLRSNFVSAEEIDASSVGAVGGTIGVKLTPGLSVQFDLDQGFGELMRRYEGIGITFAGPGATREEIERLGVYQRFERYWKPQVGWSALIVWRDAQPRRVTAAVFGGVSSIRFHERYLITSLRIPPGVDPNHRSIQPSEQKVTNIRGGLVGGVIVPIAVANRISVAPEIRYTYGSIGDERYTVFASGVRLLWMF